MRKGAAAQTPSILSVENFDQRIREAVEDLSGLSILAVFGSRAQGRHRPDSDLDVAILPSREVDAEGRRRLQARVAAKLDHLAARGRVDIVFFDEAPELLRHRVFKTGRAVLCRDPDAWKELRVRTMREHGDREDYRRLMRRAQHRRLTEGRPSGRSGRALRSFERSRDLLE